MKEGVNTGMATNQPLQSNRTTISCNDRIRPVVQFDTKLHGSDELERLEVLLLISVSCSS